MSNKIVINGVIVASGNNISIQNGRITVDGQEVTPDAKVITINIEGPVERLEVDACQKVSVKGNVGSIKTVSGDVEVNGSIDGPVQTVSGDVDCRGAIGGAVTTVSGDVDVNGPVSGSVSTKTGDVTHRK